MRPIWIVGWGTLAISLVDSCSVPAQEKPNRRHSSLQELSQVTQLAATFDNSDEGHRLVLLLSPT